MVLPENEYSRLTKGNLAQAHEVQTDQKDNDERGVAVSTTEKQSLVHLTTEFKNLEHDVRVLSRVKKSADVVVQPHLDLSRIAFKKRAREQIARSTRSVNLHRVCTNYTFREYHCYRRLHRGPNCHTVISNSFAQGIESKRSISLSIAGFVHGVEWFLVVSAKPKPQNCEICSISCRRIGTDSFNEILL